jgi:hypothetical protein
MSDASGRARAFERRGSGRPDSPAGKPAESAATPKFPDRRADLDHRDLNEYMETKKVRSILTEMICYLVEQRADDHIDGAIRFFDQYRAA